MNHSRDMKDLLQQWPKSICFRLTRACNARCDFCQAPNVDERELSLDWLEDTARRLRLRGVDSVKLSGGEPTVYRELPAVIAMFGNLGFKVTLITNGVLLRDTVLAALSSVRASVKFSVHYPDARNDQVLGIRSFEKIVKNGSTLVSEGIDFSLNSVLDRRNIAEIASMVSLAENWKCRKISFVPLVFRGAARLNLNSALMDESTYVHVRSEVALLANTASIDVHLIDIRTQPYWIIDHDRRLFVSGCKEEDDIYIDNW